MKLRYLFLAITLLLVSLDSTKAKNKYKINRNREAKIVTVETGNNIEGSLIAIKGKFLHSKKNPAVIKAANENGDIFQTLEIEKANPKQIQTRLPYVSATRVVILELTGGLIDNGSPEQIPIVVFNNPAFLDEENGNPLQASTDNGASIFNGVKGERGPQGDAGADGNSCISETDITGENNTFTGNNIFGDSSTDTLTLISTIQGANPLVFEGATADNNETTLAVADPSSDRTLTLPDATGTLALLEADSQTFTGSLTIGDAISDTLDINASIQGSSPLVFEGTTNDSNKTTFNITDPTDTRFITFPDTSGYVETNVQGLTAAISGSSLSLSGVADAYGTNSISISNTGTISTITGGLGIGEILILSGNNVTIDDNDDTTTSNQIDLAATNTDFTLDTGEAIILIYTSNYWVELGHVGDAADN